MFAFICKRIPVKRLWQTLNINLRINPYQRANWARRHNVFHNIGEHVSLQMRKIPLYPQLISMGNNIIVGSNVTFLTHDAIDQVVNYNSETKINEKIGCIEILDNCFIGANSIIYNNVRIGPNAVVAAGAVVTKDVPSGTVVGGVPATIIDRYDNLVKKRIEQTIKEEKVIRIGSQEISDLVVCARWKKFADERRCELKNN